MFNNFTTLLIPNTKKVLDKYELEIDLYNGEVTKKNKRGVVSYANNGEAVKLFTALVYVTYNFEDGYIIFDYNTSKKIGQFSESYMTIKEPQEWFKIFEEIGIGLAKDLGYNKILINSGKLDKEFLLNNNYTAERNFKYVKTKGLW